MLVLKVHPVDLKATPFRSSTRIKSAKHMHYIVALSWFEGILYVFVTMPVI